MRCPPPSLLVVLLAACGGASPPPAPVVSGSAPASASGLPATYAALFRAHTQPFTGESVRSVNDGAGPTRSAAAVTVTCTIGDVRAVADHTTATLSCTSPDGLPTDVAVTLVGTETGLYAVERFDGNLAALTDKQRLLPAQPSQDRREYKGDDEGFGEAVIVEPHGAAWCVTRAMWGGDEAGVTLCVREGQGLVGGHAYAAGGSSHDVYWGDVPRR